ncbi:AraC family transcriptional regulator [Marinomonas atlantica]|uniref:AraC family transcriptional regulator n=1 Tax=Marinomonas atlantica TaxID=1806668 RepID=UPI0008320F4F|nr:AraC family transcriptional regulator [Marinomonas atlantica]
MTEWRENHDSYLPLQAGSAQLTDFMLQNGEHLDVFLRKTKLFQNDLQCPDVTLSATQLAQLYRNTSAMTTHPDLALRLGQQLLPSNLVQYSAGLMYAPDVARALGFLEHTQALWSPLVHITSLTSVGHLHWYFSDAQGVLLDAYERNTLFVATMEALRSALCWLGQGVDGRQWRYELNSLSPALNSECQSHWLLGDVQHAAFACLTIPKAQLTQPFIHASDSLYQMTCQQIGSVPASFLGAIQSYLLEQVTDMPSLQHMADRLAMSPATLKRKLKAHRTSYQKQVDSVRALLSHHYAHVLGYSSEQIADTLCFYDVSNFRRAMKRWVIMT